MTTEPIPEHILATLRRATRKIQDLELQAKTIEAFVQEETAPLGIKPGDMIDLESGMITRAEKATE